MRLVRTCVAAVLFGVLALVPMPGCVGAGPNPVGSLASIALTVGASVGTYLLIQELK